MRYFRPKSDHSNERIYDKPIDRRLKTLLNSWAAFYEQPLLSYGSFSRNSSVFETKRKHKYKILEIFEIGFHNLQKELKNTIPDTMAIDLL